MIKTLPAPLTTCRPLALAVGLAMLLPCFSTRAGTEGQPTGEFVEIHSVELFTGGCTASSESTLLGREMLRVWKFTGGEFRGVELAGLAVASASAAQGNLADPTTQPTALALYLPASASDAQRSALAVWAEAQSGFPATRIRVLPIAYDRQAESVSVTIGNIAQLTTAPLPDCSTNSCGEMLWYRPRAANSGFVVLQNAGSSVIEPALRVRWSDYGRNSVFLARFGEPESGGCPCEGQSHCAFPELAVATP